MFQNFIYIAAGAILGAWGRYSMFLIFDQHVSWIRLGTIISNISGCALIGVIYVLSDTLGWPKHITIFLIVGMLGSYTTFSAFSLEVSNLFISGAYLRGFQIFLMHNLLCLLATVVAILATKFIVNQIG